MYVLQMFAFVSLDGHKCSLQPFSQDYDLFSYATDIVCVNFIHERRGLQVDSERLSFSDA